MENIISQNSQKIIFHKFLRILYFFFPFSHFLVFTFHTFHTFQTFQTFHTFQTFQTFQTFFHIGGFRTFCVDPPIPYTTHRVTVFTRCSLLHHLFYLLFVVNSLHLVLVDHCFFVFRCILSFEVLYSVKSPRGPYKRVNKVDIIFTSFHHVLDQGKLC